MSTTYIHYKPPSSLPSDYSILARYNAHNDAAHDQPDELTSQVDEDEELHAPYGAVSIPGRSGGRRNTFSHGQTQRRMSNPQLRPLEAAASGAAWGTSVPAVPSENDPLLMQVPRIHEDCDDADDSRNMYMEELKVLLRYSLPVFGTQLFEYSLQVASIVSIGHLSTTALAAATLASMTASVTGFSIAQGLTSALDTLLPAAWTSGHPEFVGLWSQRMAVVITATLVPIIVLWFNAESVLLFLGQEAEVASLAALYLKWMSVGMPAYGLNAVIR
ncbi:hypothetical protein EXIGLDRAFT_763366 [Exidia glandulosa HHB12029]|uniref:Mate-domain-containing protein n=1 Tax=Exidia glandulosa HHB12029 TaxID=1314781 RepID=A0A166B7U5_EXIGL|nr:hypothetical protein EXIGLDRAFT_763366 [Exidia glandulosa HHB12029]